MWVCLAGQNLSYAQKANLQMWGDHEFHFPFANTYSFKTETSYRTLLSDEQKWRSLQFHPQLSANVLTFADLLLSVPVIFTAQTDTVNTSEIRLMVGTRLFLNSIKRVHTQVMIRFERRHLKHIGEGDWSTGNRLRVRGDLIIPINQNSYFEDKQWYSLMKVEAFFVEDDVYERFANRLRLSFGAGYRLNYTLRFEAEYNAQSSRNQISEQFSSTDHIIRFRIMHYINKARISE